MLPDTSLTGDGIDASYGNDYFWANNAAAERCLRRGSYWAHGVYAGVFCLNLDNPRSFSSSNLGGRSALVEL
jgi:hypothetical protein